MKDLFNKNFFHLVVVFMGILLLSFVFTAVVTNFGEENTMQATVPVGS